LRKRSAKIGEQAAPRRGIIKAALSTTKTAAQMRKASGEQATSAAQITQASGSMRRGAATASRAPPSRASAPIPPRLRRVDSMIASISKAMSEQATGRAADQHRDEQHAPGIKRRALSEQTRGEEK
jgi:hypothetical protein